MVEQSQRPEQAVQLHLMAAQVLASQLHMAAQLPRNFIVDQTKWSPLFPHPGTQLMRYLTRMCATIEADSRLRHVI